VVGAEVALERLATGFAFTEGPIWHPHERHLTFSDMPGDHMRRWTAAGGLLGGASIVRPMSNRASVDVRIIEIVPPEQTRPYHLVGVPRHKRN
jgi:sugar lactone lactonase YvrE